jgi:phosphatidylglycerophosphate synthase
MLRVALALLSAVLVTTKLQSLTLSGCLLYALCVLLDYVDGNLARLYGTASEYSGLLEELADQVGPSLFPLAIGIGLYFRPDRLLRAAGSVDPVWALVVGALTSIAYCLGTMALLYTQVKQTKAHNRAETAPRLPVLGGHSDGFPVLQRAHQLARLGVTEGVYLAVVFGLVLAATLDFMSIYLVARGIRNLTFLFSWIRRLVARLSEVRG